MRFEKVGEMRTRGALFYEGRTAAHRPDGKLLLIVNDDIVALAEGELVKPRINEACLSQFPALLPRMPCDEFRLDLGHDPPVLSGGEIEREVLLVSRNSMHRVDKPRALGVGIVLHSAGLVSHRSVASQTLRAPSRGRVEKSEFELPLRSRRGGTA